MRRNALNLLLPLVNSGAVSQNSQKVDDNTNLKILVTQFSVRICVTLGHDFTLRVFGLCPE